MCFHVMTLFSDQATTPWNEIMVTETLLLVETWETITKPNSFLVKKHSHKKDAKWFSNLLCKIKRVQWHFELESEVRIEAKIAAKIDIN